jgi:hypothetical protein
MGTTCLGVDAFQAIQIAQAMIHVDLITCPEYKRGSLYWLSPESGDLGFPSVLEGAMGAKRKQSRRRAERRVGPKDGQMRRSRPNES